VQKAEPVIVVLDVQRAAESFRKALEETEEARICADTSAVEGRGVERETDILVGVLVDCDRVGAAVAVDREFDAFLGGVELVIDCIAESVSIYGQHTDAGPQPGLVCQASRLDIVYQSADPAAFREDGRGRVGQRSLDVYKLNSHIRIA